MGLRCRVRGAQASCRGLAPVCAGPSCRGAAQLGARSTHVLSSSWPCISPAPVRGDQQGCCAPARACHSVSLPETHSLTPLFALLQHRRLCDRALHHPPPARADREVDALTGTELQPAASQLGSQPASGSQPARQPAATRGRTRGAAAGMSRRAAGAPNAMLLQHSRL